MAKTETFKSKMAMKIHEKKESAKKVASEKKSGEKDVVKKPTKKGK